jgi:cell division protein FtsI (penicillin-binding protein 3)
MALDMGVERHRAFLKKLGLMDRVTTELGDSAAPIIPQHWQKLNSMTIAFGHGLSVTPLQLASAALPLVNGGIAVTPTFLPRSREDGMREGKRVLKAATSAAMLKLMRLNVLKGTAKRADVEGYRVGGKTGTAEMPGRGGYQEKAVISSFIGAFPMDAPRYVVFVLLFQPQTGETGGDHITAGLNAAPATARIVERIAPLLGVLPRRMAAGLAN